MKARPKNRRDAGRLLGPIFHEFCCRLWWLTAGLSPENDVLLFMARGGLRLHFLFELFLELNHLPMPISRERFWISRFAAVKLSFAEASDLAADNLAREFAAGTCRDLAAALLPEQLYPEKAGLTETLPTDLISAPVTRENVLRLFAAPCPFSETLRTHFREQHDIGHTAFDARFGKFAALHAVDTGWFGSALGSLQAGFPGRHWDAFFFGRWNYRGNVPPHFGDVYGLMIDAEGRKVRSGTEVFLEYHHLIESVLEPELPSVEYYLPDGSCNAMIPGWEKRIEGAGENELWEGVKEYFADRPAMDLCSCTAATERVLKQWKRLLRYPSPAEARLLEVPPRSADFGKRKTVPVFAVPEQSGAAARLRGIKRSLWPAGAIAVSCRHGIRLRQMLWRWGRRLLNDRGAV